MFSLRKPPLTTIAARLDAQADLPLSYDAVGVTRGDRPSSFRRNHHRVKLGTGAATYAAAVAALRSWAMYRLSWTELYPAGAPVEAGTVIAVIVRHLGFWSVNPCRVVYHERTSGDVRSEAFAIGTLPDHGETGEERFRVAWHAADDAVWFEILSFAEPRHWLARLGAPIVHRIQRRFGTEALRAMQSAVAAKPAS